MNEKRTVLVMLMTGVLLSSLAAAQGLLLKSHPVTDAYEGWHLGTQAYSFRKFTFYEAVDKAASLGLNWIEAYPGQKLSKERPNVRLNHTMLAQIREEVRRKLAESRVKLVNYGVVRLPNDEAECRKVFDFAKDMGIETIVAEPKAEAFDLVEKLCKEYKIKVAIHNHPSPSRYWHPDKVLEVCKGRSKWIGACADTGHWMRSGVNPLEALKKLEGRIISFHFKDLNKFSERKAHDVVWGTGKANVEALLKELHRQGFEGVFSIEYEHNWDNSVPEIRQCVEYFNKIAGGLKPTGWRDLVANDLSNCVFKPGSWAMEEGVLTRKGTKKSRGDIWTKERYGDFVLDVEFRLAERTNSGIFFRTDNIGAPVQTGIEVQVFDSHGRARAGTHDCGAVYDCLAPSKNMVKKAGEWNRGTITCKANKIYVVMNGEQIIDMDLNLWTEPNKNPDETKNKYKKAFKDRPRVGHIGFQDHGHPVWYRNIKIKRLGKG
jgi:sugar phosphate isomerase/epimerase